MSNEKCRHGYPVGGWIDDHGQWATCGGCWQDAAHATEAARVATLTPAQREQEKAAMRAFNASRPNDGELELQDLGIYDGSIR